MHSTTEISAFTRSVESAIAANQYDVAVGVLSERWPNHVALHGHVVRGLIERLPPTVWQSDPWLVTAVAASFSTAPTAKRDAGLPYLNAAEQLVAAHRDAPLTTVVGVALHRAAALRSLGQLNRAGEAVSTARAALASAVDVAPSSRAGFEAGIAMQSGMVSLHLGDYDAAEAALVVARDLAIPHLRAEEHVECLGAAAYLAYSLGNLAQATALVATAKRTAEANWETPIPVASRFGAPALITETLVAIERADEDAAQANARSMRRASRNSDWELLGLHCEAAVSVLSGEYLEGLEILGLMLVAEREWEPAGAARHARLALKSSLLDYLGDSYTSAGMLRHLEPTQHHATCPAVQAGRLRIRARDFAGALQEIAPCTALGDAHSDRTNVDVLLICAAAHYGLGNPQLGDPAFDAATRLAVRIGSLRPFHLFPTANLSSMVASAVGRALPAPLQGFVARLHEDVRARSAQETLRRLAGRQLAAS